MGRAADATLTTVAAAGLLAGLGMAWIVTHGGPDRPGVPPLPFAVPVAVLIGWSFIGSGLLYSRSRPDNHLGPVLITFAFGLSMDYEVFLLSRIKEAYDECGDTNRAVADGLQPSGRVITSAAFLIMIVFLGFAAGQTLGIKEMGLALAIAVAVDATLRRCVLVPATMTTLTRAHGW